MKRTLVASESQCSFTVYIRPEPQGSKRAMLHKSTGRAVMIDDNKKMRPYRQEVTRSAISELQWTGEPMAAKHVPVEVALKFYFAKPGSAKKSRLFPVVKPDVDKLLRATLDALTGIVYHDDAQVVRTSQEKLYGIPERVEITARTL